MSKDQSRSRSKRLLVAVAGLAAAQLLTSTAVAAQTLPVSSTQDTTAPQITSIVIDPVEVDVTDGSWKTFTATVTATDDLSGVDDIWIAYLLPSLESSQAIYLGPGSSDPVTGDRKHGTYRATATIKPEQANGVYGLSSASVRDAVGNQRVYRADDVPGPSSLKVIGNTDVTPPVATSITLSPAVLDVTEHSQRAAGEVAITDDRSGLAALRATFYSPSGQQYVELHAGPADGQPGVAQGEVTVERFAESGDWWLGELCATDNVGNRGCATRSTSPGLFATKLTVVSTPDVSKPELTAFRLLPTAIDVTQGSQDVTVELDVKDDMAGVYSANIQLLSPILWEASTPQVSRTASMYAPPVHTTVRNADGTWSQVDNDANRLLSGTLRGTITFPQYDRAGEWYVARVCLGDNVRRSICYERGTTPSLNEFGSVPFVVKWNHAPTVKVTGVAAGSYVAGAEPTAGCDVNDAEDGAVTTVRPTITRSGDTVAVTCSYTDNGLDDGRNPLSASDSASYTVTRPTNTAPRVKVTGVGQASYEVRSEPVAGCTVDDAEDAGATAVPQVGALSGPLAAYGAGKRTVTCAFTDSGGLAGRDSVEYAVVDTTKPVVDGRPTTAANAAGWYNGDVTIHWTVTDSGVGVSPDAAPGDVTVSVEGKDQTRTAAVRDRAGNDSGVVTSSPAVSLDKTAPVVASAAFTVNPKSVSQTSTLSVGASDALSGLAGGEYSIGSAAAKPLAVVDGKLQASFGTGLTPGTYQVSVRAVDAAGNWSPTTSVTLVVYDPDAGSVTGGGTVDTASGKVTFGVGAQYQKGARLPTGNTEVQARDANLNFASTSYEWLVVSGATAQYKGQGTVNGKPGYTFLVTVADGGAVDKFRVKIWSDSGVVFDTMPGASDDPSNAKPLSGGSGIVIHA